MPAPADAPTRPKTGVPPAHRVLMSIHLPIDMRLFVNMVTQVAALHPAAEVHNLDDHIVAITIPAEVD